MRLEDFVSQLKHALEEHSVLLQRGDIFLPKYLKGKNFTNNCFPNVMTTLSKKSGLPMKMEYTNKFDNIYEIGTHQRVDYAFLDTNDKPSIFFELESLGRSQLYLFSDATFREKENDNKLWYYYGTLGNYYTWGHAVPQYFIFFLCLPNQKVEPYQLWDLHKEYRLFHPALRQKVFLNPYLFYDRQIKAQARAFLQRQNYYMDDGAKWDKKVGWQHSQKICELIFVTCTIEELILSRGRDLFDPLKEQTFKINW